MIDARRRGAHGAAGTASIPAGCGFFDRAEIQSCWPPVEAAVEKTPSAEAWVRPNPTERLPMSWQRDETVETAWVVLGHMEPSIGCAGYAGGSL